MPKLYINNVEIELEPSKPIARTLQVNDIADITNRQANFTPTIKIPKTANNIKAFVKLGLVGSSSNIPYQKNNAYLYSDNGDCLIYNGWAVIKETSDTYSCNLYDGAIDFYKAIENKKLSDLNLTEINHFKTLNNVIDSFNGLTTYKYILADYNGKAKYDGTKINIDYLIPSIPVSFLWDRVFDTFGFTYSGVVFDTFDFQNFYMTYPKGVAESNPTGEVIYTNPSFSWSSYTPNYLIHNNPAPTQGEFLSDNIGYVALVDGTYKITSFNSSIVVNGVSSSQPYPISIPYKIVAEKNYSQEFEIYDSLTDIHTPQLIQMIIGDIIRLKIVVNGYVITSVVAGSTSFGMEIRFLSGQIIDFNETFVDFNIKDFINEILVRFALIPFKNKYSNNIVFKTLSEILQDNNVVDWTSKFVGINSESYIFNSYAQENNFVYKYNDKEENFNDGGFAINNKNLPEKKDIFKSAVYSPEKKKSTVLPDYNIYKLWDKQIKEGGLIEYKDLDKRFYFMRAIHTTFPNIVIGSELYQNEASISQAPIESFLDLSFSDIIQKYYGEYGQILDKAKVLNLNIYLTEQDIRDIDFSFLIWIEQLSSYFMLNKIHNFTGNGIVKCELVKVDYTTTSSDIFYQIYITSFVAGCLYFNNPDGLTSLTVERSTDNGVTWTSNTGGGASPRCGFTVTQTTLFRIKNTFTGFVVSNVFEVTI